MDQKEIEALKHLISYDPNSGVFAWVKRPRIVSADGMPGRTDKSGYRQIQIMGKAHAAHRLAFVLMLGRPPSQVVDHINGDPADNRWSNLRECSTSINAQNRRNARIDNQSSGLLGAHWEASRGKWKSQIRTNGRVKHLGYFQTPQEAHAAYVEAKRRLHPGCTI